MTHCENSNNHISKIREIEWKKDADKQFVGYCRVDGSSCFVQYGMMDSTLGFYSIEHSKLVRDIYIGGLIKIESIEKQLMRFQILNPDSIFLIIKNKILLINAEGNEIRHWNIGADFNDSFECIIPFKSNFAVWENRLFFSVVGNTRVNDAESRSNYFSKIYPIAYLDMHTDSIHSLPIQFPDIYHHGMNYMDFVPAFDVFQDHIVVSFGVSDFIYVYDLAHDILKSYPCKSKFYVKPKHFPDDSSHNFAYRRKYDFEQMRYGEIYTDEKSGFLLRFVSVPTEQARNSSFEYKHVKNWSLIIFNLDTHELIGEQFFNSDDWAPFIVESDDGFLVWKMAERKSDSLNIVEFTIRN